MGTAPLGQPGTTVLPHTPLASRPTVVSEHSTVLVSFSSVSGGIIYHRVSSSLMPRDMDKEKEPPPQKKNPSMTERLSTSISRLFGYWLPFKMRVHVGSEDSKWWWEGEDQHGGVEWEQTDLNSNQESFVPSDNSLTFLICIFQLFKIERVPSACAQHRAVKIQFNHSFVISETMISIY